MDSVSDLLPPLKLFVRWARLSSIFLHSKTLGSSWTPVWEKMVSVVSACLALIPERLEGLVPEQRFDISPSDTRTTTTTGIEESSESSFLRDETRLWDSPLDVRCRCAFLEEDVEVMGFAALECDGDRVVIAADWVKRLDDFDFDDDDGSEKTRSGGMELDEEDENGADADGGKSRVGFVVVGEGGDLDGVSEIVIRLVHLRLLTLNWTRIKVCFFPSFSSFYITLLKIQDSPIRIQQESKESLNPRKIKFMVKAVPLPAPQNYANASLNESEISMKSPLTPLNRENDGWNSSRIQSRSTNPVGLMSIVSAEDAMKTTISPRMEAVLPDYLLDDAVHNLPPPSTLPSSGLPSPSHHQKYFQTGLKMHASGPVQNQSSPGSASVSVSSPLMVQHSFHNSLSPLLQQQAGFVENHFGTPISLNPQTTAMDTLSFPEGETLQAWSKSSADKTSFGFPDSSVLSSSSENTGTRYSTKQIPRPVGQSMFLKHGPDDHDHNDNQEYAEEHEHEDETVGGRKDELNTLRFLGLSVRDEGGEVLEQCRQREPMFPPQQRKNGGSDVTQKSKSKKPRMKKHNGSWR
jgi:hypothetical protein